MSQKKPLAVAPRSVTLRDFAIFQLKLLLDGDDTKAMPRLHSFSAD